MSSSTLKGKGSKLEAGFLCIKHRSKLLCVARPLIQSSLCFSPVLEQGRSFQMRNLLRFLPLCKREDFYRLYGCNQKHSVSSVFLFKQFRCCVDQRFIFFSPAAAFLNTVFKPPLRGLSHLSINIAKPGLVGGTF